MEDKPGKDEKEKVTKNEEELTGPFPPEGSPRKYPGIIIAIPPFPVTTS